MKTRHEVCPVDDIPPGERRIVDLDGYSIGIFNVDGTYYALKNECPHRRVALCEGAVTGTVTADTVGEYDWVKDGQILRCPAHGWEFDLTTGESVFNPHRVRAYTYRAAVEPHSDDARETSDTACGGGCEQSRYGTALAGDEPPVETYTVETEDEVVVVYV